MERLQKALEDLKNRKPVFIYDAEGREEETDIVFASGSVAHEDVRFLRQNGGGLICTTVSDDVAEKIDLPFLVDVFKTAQAVHPVLRNSLPDTLPYDTKSAFSLTINHRKCYTGITDNDRALTIAEFGKLVGEVECGTSENPLKSFTKGFRVPGHVFLLRTSKELLKDRIGHTELSTAMCLMAGLPATATICEMMGNDGNALSRADARKFAESRGFIFLEGHEVQEVWKSWSK
ncbi:MAG: 3,4-dihydroxy-2-butanone-4-phosphate synthase [Candidatus Thermoplasmatota archaeon]|nr:3,4-dihydroxy-2-butanone-4-phosphate synthase [Euryarchaeota archaeon]MBU4031913.1 3,4-dihydroxy-2-butanone-4-phosphate synthase [Candidatus Thermoplasmatota archaeon]MBU4072189.1 3,4-dihydroxy-2-butanone-4-phosphate synthase [Candidatus Thermoplasmatota archaeon]MBU4145009.1 3,4-dihydroxy-2-butanone-4-phosphate synthase [Candidatus Thermoplasmatota archaeon]MBU4592023.1 3,4-dihydroxy-2-butanone-4-phosphate synthase [Candidatus Thermoplasmatota archaeon]